jgi:cytoskeletal protein CcmA (bactofilin family)
MDVATSGASMSLVSENVKIDGELEGVENILINGRVSGSIKLDGDVVIGRSGIVDADIDGNTVVIQGTVRGNVTARTHLEIQASGKMTGDITARSIDIKEGSSFEGRSRMLKPDPNHEKPTASQSTAAPAEKG